MKGLLILHFAPLSVLVACDSGAVALDALGLLQRAVGVSQEMSNSSMGSMELSTRMPFLMNTLEGLMAPTRSTGKNDEGLLAPDGDDGNKAYNPRWRQAPVCAGKAVLPGGDTGLGIFESFTGMRVNCPQQGNGECPSDVSNFVGNIMNLVALAFNAPMTCLSQPRDCRTSRGWKSLRQTSVFLQSTGIVGVSSPVGL